ncbi:allantoicase [Streptacidiphilus pinicola]|uniref:Probable allantoicase n=1 Tax=Streptacidiphilus pinicola TaxID=2219663 RepID=A0A2X0J9A3_9ACTN|nr:allantoicase [Streptacidiphilus pinicola]RAG84058.1 allantoicase [Streptacidiphilus pinicola]
MQTAPPAAPFAVLPDLASRQSGGSVVGANDELFAERENLINPAPAEFRPYTFGPKGQIMDGWETRRRRETGYDWAVVRLGTAGVIRGVIVDTAFFIGNYPPFCSVEAAAVEPLGAQPTAVELAEADWHEIVPRSALKGDTANPFEVASELRFTHVRLNIFPDGGVARLRVHGEALPDPRWALDTDRDLAALENGGRVLDCSNRFYSSPDNILRSGPARVMGEGWETSRRRDDGNDWAVVQLAAQAEIDRIEIDTTCFVGNAAGSARVTGCDATAADPEHPDSWFELLPRTRLEPDTVHRFRLDRTAVRRPVSRVRLDIFPDGGLARFRVHGSPTAAGRAAIFRTWADRLPETALLQQLTGFAGAEADAVAQLVAARPFGSDDKALTAAVARLLASAPLAGDERAAAAWRALTGV